MTIKLYIEGSTASTQIGYALFYGDILKLKIKNQEENQEEYSVICDITDETLTFPDGVQKIVLFKNIDITNTSLNFTKIKFPDSITHINCSSSITGSEEHLINPNFLFKDLKALYLSKNLESIAIFSFANIHTLEKVVFPLEAPISLIPKGCFYYCKQLHTVILSDKIKEIGYDSFKKTKINNIQTRNTNIDLLEIPDQCLSMSQTVDYILSGAFQLNSLETVVLPDNLEFIGEFALEMSKDKPIYIKLPKTIHLMSQFCISIYENSNSNKIILPDYIEVYSDVQCPSLSKLISSKNEIIGSTIVKLGNFMFSSYNKEIINTSELESNFNFTDIITQMNIYLHLHAHIGEIKIGHRTQISKITYSKIEDEIGKVSTRFFLITSLDKKGNSIYKLRVSLDEIETKDSETSKILLNLIKDLINEPTNVLCDDYISNVLKYVGKDEPLTLLNIFNVAMQLKINISEKLSEDVLYKLLSCVVINLYTLIDNLRVIINYKVNSVNNFPTELLEYINNNLNGYTIEIEDLEDFLNVLSKEPIAIKNCILSILYNIAEI